MGRKNEKHIIVTGQTKLKFDRAKAEHAEAQHQSVTQDEYIRHLLALAELAPRLAAALAQVSDDLDIFGYDDLLYEAEATGLITPAQDTDP
ncbi:MAG: hypothetical protein H8E35_01140 [Ardenticatenia bacterium]|nr:hypothetical protein [Ardenticatenia bacterium]